MSGLGSSTELAHDKLVILYCLEMLAMPVNNLQLVKFIVERRFIGHLFVQQYLAELCKSKDIDMETADGMSVYHITDKGRQTLKYLKSRILPGIRKMIEESAQSQRRSIFKDISITADYTPVNENEFVAECAIREGDFLIMEIKVAVGSKKDAKAICRNWKNDSTGIYSDIVDRLAEKRCKNENGAG